MSPVMAGITVCLILMAAHLTSAELVSVMPPAGEIHGNIETQRFDGKDYTYTVFKSIPFAESTEGSNRFQKPVKKQRFDTPYQALKMGPICPQKLYPTLDMFEVSEDCLHLSVVVPGNVTRAKNLPVMIFVYGGGFMMGWHDTYVWPAMSTVNDVIFVSFNYRVGVYGFLSNGPKSNLKGNYGLWDQHMAIQWVKENIEQFGGDTGKITIYGESAGSASVMYQALFPQNEGLFQNVIAQSGTTLNPWAYSPNPTHLFSKFATSSNCHSEDYEDDMISCLQGLEMKDIENNVGDWDMYVPTMDGELLQMPPEEIIAGGMSAAKDHMDFFGSLNVVMGFNTYDGIDTWLDQWDDLIDMNMFDRRVADGTDMIVNLNEKMKKLFATTVKHQYMNWSDPWNMEHIRQASADVYTDFFYLSGIVKTAMHHEMTGKGGHVFLYEFAHKPSMSNTGDWLEGPIHAEDLLFVFGFPRDMIYLLYGENSAPYTDMDPASVIPSDEMKLSKDMMALWAQIAKNGKPDDMKQWPAFDIDSQQHIVFKANMTSFPVESHGMRPEYVNFWNVVVPEIKRVSAMTDSGCGWDPDMHVASAMAPVSTVALVFVSALLVLVNNIA